MLMFEMKVSFRCVAWHVSPLLFTLAACLSESYDTTKPPQGLGARCSVQTMRNSPPGLAL